MSDGRFPGVTIEYASYHRPLLSPANVDDGIADLVVAARIDFDSPDAGSRLLQAAEQTENAAALVVALQGFLANDSEDPELHDWLAAALLAAGAPEQALVHSLEALRLSPDSPVKLTTQGNILKALGRPDEARHSYEKTLVIEPESEPAREGLRRLRELEARRQ